MILNLIENLGLLLALTFLYSLLLPMRHRLPARGQALLQGVVFGLFAIISLFVPLNVGNGFLFDGRNAMIAVSTIYGGAVAGLVSAGLVIPVRFFLGGVGAIGGAGSLLVTVAICEWFRRRYLHGGLPHPASLVLLGVVISLQGVLWVFLAPFEQALEMARNIVVPLLLLNPLAIVLISSVLSYEVRRVHLETALHESEHRLRQIAEVSEQLLWIYNPRSEQAVYVSPAYERIWQRPLNNLSNGIRSFIDTVHPDDRERVSQLLRQPEGYGVADEVRILRPDGSERWILARVYPVTDEDTGQQHIVGTAEDITERKAAEAERVALAIERKHAAMLRQFISDASHDLRTPITVMNTSLYLLNRVLETDQQRQYAGQVQTQVNRMGRMVEDMLIITQLDSGETQFQLVPMPLNRIAQAAYDRRLPETQAKNRELTLVLTDETLYVNADEVEIAKALDRVMKNAVAYTTAGGRIHVSTSRRGDQGIIEVRDDGVGIDSADLPHIFERFYRADKARGSDAGGAGLGLSIAQKAMELHNGHIEAEGAPGNGSVFRFVLPLTAATPAAADGRLASDGAHNRDVG